MLQCLNIIHKHKALTDSRRIQGLMENAGSWWGEATLPEDREEINLRRGKTNEKIDKHYTSTQERPMY